MEGLSIHQISKIAEGTVQQSSGEPLWVQPAGVSIDSRTIGNRELFFALTGEHTDGHQFVEQALRSGACGAVVRQSWLDRQQTALPGILIGVEDPLAALQQLARDYRRRFDIPVAAIVGTNGKTTTKDMVACVLETAYRVLKTEGNFNNHIGVPLTILSLSSKHQVGVMELGTSGAGELASLCQLADPSLGVITNVGTAHLESFGSIERIAAAKGELLDYLDQSATTILNGDDPLVMAQAPRARGDTITFGLSEASDFRAEALESDGFGGFRFTVRDTAFRLNVPGKINVYNALAAICIGDVLGVQLKDASRALAGFRPSPMRMEVVERRGIRILNDAYNANPVSTKAALDVLGAFPAGPAGRRIAVLGDMLELGPTDHDLHRELGHYAFQSGLDHLVLIGPLSESTRHGASDAGMSAEQVRHFSSHDSAIRWVRGFCRAGDVVLVKGSRAMKMETIVEAIGSLG